MTGAYQVRLMAFAAGLRRHSIDRVPGEWIARAAAGYYQNQQAGVLKRS